MYNKYFYFLGQILAFKISFCAFGGNKRSSICYCGQAIWTHTDEAMIESHNATSDRGNRGPLEWGGGGRLLANVKAKQEQSIQMSIYRADKAASILSASASVSVNCSLASLLFLTLSPTLRLLRFSCVPLSLEICVSLHFTPTTNGG